MTLITDTMRAGVGTVLSTRVSFPIETSDIRRWAVAVYWPEPPPRHLWDPEYAEATQDGGFAALAEFNPFAWMVADCKHIAEFPDPPMKFRLNGGVSMEYGVPMRPGDVITGVRSVGEFDEKEGKRGPMLLSTSVDRWTNQRGEFVRLHHFTTIWYGLPDD